jgi:branched-chain amino acid transport system substrate-binding protein
VPADLTGADASFGVVETGGIKAAAAYINDHGGIAGRQIELTIKDVQTNPAIAVTETQNALTGGGYQAVMDGGGSVGGRSIAIAGVATTNNLLFINVGGDDALADPKKFPTSFSLQPPTSLAGDALACLVKKNFNAKTAAAITGISAYSKIELAQFSKHGIELVETDVVTATDTDFTAIIQRIAAKKPDVLVVSIFGPQTGQILNNLHAVGYSGHVAGGILMTAQPVRNVVTDISVLPASLANVISSPYVRVNGKFSDLWQQLLDRVGSVLGKSPLAYAAPGWDGIQLIKYAFENSPSTKIGDLVKTIESLDGTKDIGTLGVAMPQFDVASHQFQSSEYYQVDYTEELVNGTYSSNQQIPTSC